MKRYHFSLGDSTNGPVGYCAAVWAANAQEAVQLLADAIPNEADITVEARGDDEPGVEYIEVYFNDRLDKHAVSTADIDEVEDVDGNSYPEEAGCAHKHHDPTMCAECNAKPDIASLAFELADYVAHSDFFTDAPEYREAVERARELASRIIAQPELKELVKLVFGG